MRKEHENTPPECWTYFNPQLEGKTNNNNKKWQDICLFEKSSLWWGCNYGKKHCGSIRHPICFIHTNIHSGRELPRKAFPKTLVVHTVLGLRPSFPLMRRFLYFFNWKFRVWRDGLLSKVLVAQVWESAFGSWICIKAESGKCVSMILELARPGLEGPGSLLTN